MWALQQIVHNRQTETKDKKQKMKTLLKMISSLFASSTRYAKLSDIKGSKSGGIRDSNKVDWKQTISQTG